MQPCAKPAVRGLLVVGLMVLAGCGAVRRDDGGQAPVTGSSRPTPAAPPATGAAAPLAAPIPPPDKGNPEQRFAQALGMMRGNQIAEAEAAFVALTTDFPEFSGGWTDLGILYAKSNRRDAALAALSRAVSLNRQNAVAQNWLGILYREARDYSRAERHYQAALSAQPDYGLAHLNLGILYDEYLKRPAAALPHYQAYRLAGGKDDLRVLAWIAEIESAAKKSSAAPASPPITRPVPVTEPRR